MARLCVEKHIGLGGNDMRKTPKMLVFCIVLMITLLIPLNVLADSDISNISANDLSETFFSVKDINDFNKKTAADDAFVNLVVQAAQKKDKNISLEGVRPDKSIKIYGVKSSENPLETFCDSYTKNGSVNNSISSDYSVLSLYVNKNNEYVDSLVFTRQENLPESAAKNEWVMLCSGSMILNDDNIVEYFEYNNLTKNVENLGLKNAKELKFVSGIPNMPVVIYFVQENTEFIIPLEDSCNMKALQVYKVDDMVDSFLKPVLDYQNEKSKEYSNLDFKDRPVGTSPVPDELPSITSIDLHTYFESDTSENSGNKSDFWKIVIISSSIVVVLTVICYIIVYTRKKRLDNRV